VCVLLYLHSVLTVISLSCVCRGLGYIKDLKYRIYSMSYSVYIILVCLSILLHFFLFQMQKFIRVYENS
jgi:hypothetical protein